LTHVLSVPHCHEAGHEYVDHRICDRAIEVIMSGEEHQDKHRVGTTSARTARDDDLLFLYVTKANADFLWAKNCVKWARG
jgi:hypothetical protein